MSATTGAGGWKVAASGNGAGVRDRSRGFTALCLVQGLYYLVTGICPLVSIDTFIAVTGPKTDNLPTGLPVDHWLVEAVAVLVVVNGLSFLVGAARGVPTPELTVLAVGSAIVLTGIDVFYVTREVIPPIYLADAAAELVLIAAWIGVIARRRFV